MAAINGTLGGLTLQPFDVPFTETPIEQAVDIVTLDGSLYTDFTAQRQSLELNWSHLTLDQYKALRAVYNDQFNNAVYPEFTCSYYDMDRVPCRMTINTRDVRVNGCEVYDISVTLIAQAALISDNSWLTIESGEPILVS